jgi:hypothetical protein
MSKNFPSTLQQAIIYFQDCQNCHDFMVELRWPDGVIKCPHCGSDRVAYLDKARLWKCYTKHPMAKFSLKVGTIFEDSPIRIEKWLAAVWLIVNCKNGISSYEIGRDLGVTQKTACRFIAAITCSLIIGFGTPKEAKRQRRGKRRNRK